MNDADGWIRALELAPHPEGGWYRETWRSGERLDAGALPVRFPGSRSLGTAIVYLLRAGEVSRLHRLRADETWQLLDGGPLRLHVFEPGAGHRPAVLGRDAARGERPQHVVPHGCWFGAELADAVTFALVGCTVVPGFEFEDFEQGTREALQALHPGHAGLVKRLTPEPER